MKQMRYLVLSLLTLTLCSTAYSQITGLSREQKVEIVTGLKSYDAVIIEIDLKDQLLEQCKEINKILEKQLSNRDEVIINLQAQIKTYEDQVDVQDIQIRKQKKKNFMTVAGGAGLIILSLILK